MNEEEMRVLRMVEEGKVTPEEGARLLEAVRKREGRAPAPPPAGAGRCLRVKVFEGDRQSPKVNLAVPLALARVALKFIPRSALHRMEERGVRVDDLEDLIANAERTAPFKVLDLEDGEDKVEISVE